MNALVLLTATSILSLATLACSSDKKSNLAPLLPVPTPTEGSGNGEGTAESPTIPGPGAPSPEAPRPGAGGEVPVDVYKPLGGDSVTRQGRGRLYATSAGVVPEWSEQMKTTEEVVALYKTGLRCSYRAKITHGASVTTFVDMGCTDEISTCVAEDKPNMVCTEVAIAAKDIGAFKNAKGFQSTCRLVSEVGGKRELMQIEGKRWLHPDVLADGRVARSEMKSCTIELKLGEDINSNINACLPPAGRESRISENETEVVAQKKGNGTPDLTQIARGQFEVVGEPKNTMPVVVTCLPDLLNEGKTFSLNLRQDSCQTNTVPGTKDLSVSFNGLPLSQPNYSNEAPTRGSMLQIGESVLFDSEQSCVATYTVKDVVEGTVTCAQGSFKDFGGGDSRSVKNVSFVCLKP